MFPLGPVSVKNNWNEIQSILTAGWVCKGAKLLYWGYKNQLKCSQLCSNIILSVKIEK